MPLPDEGLIHAWLDGELDADTAARVEALVAGDEAWSAAAADARGLIAASSRIAASLDRASGAVIPRANAPRRAPRRAPRWWMTRVAAALVTIVGASVLLRRDGVAPLGDAQAAPAAVVPVPAPVADRTAPVAVKAAPKPVVAAGKARQQPEAPSPTAELRRSVSTTDHELAKREERKAKDAFGERLAAAAGSAAGNAAPSAVPAPPPITLASDSERRRANQRAVDTGNARVRGFAALDTASRNAAAQAGENAKTVGSPETVVCFRVLQPADLAEQILRFRLGDLSDSVRAGRYRHNRDSLVSLAGRLVALRQRCPER